MIDVFAQWFNTGFAAVVAGYVLMRIEPRLMELRQVISDNTVAIKILVQKIDK